MAILPFYNPVPNFLNGNSGDKKQFPKKNNENNANNASVMENAKDYITQHTNSNTNLNTNNKTNSTVEGTAERKLDQDAL